jgi:hypothetical protein
VKYTTLSVWGRKNLDISQLTRQRNTANRKLRIIINVFLTISPLYKINADGIQQKLWKMMI